MANALGIIRGREESFSQRDHNNAAAQTRGAQEADAGGAAVYGTSGRLGKVLVPDGGQSNVEHWVGGTGRNGEFIPPHTRSNGRIYGTSENPSIRITEVNDLVRVLELKPGNRPGVYHRGPDFYGEYHLQKERDGTLSVWYTGGQHKSGRELPTQTFHHGKWDRYRVSRGETFDPNTPDPRANGNSPQPQYGARPTPSTVPEPELRLPPVPSTPVTPPIPTPIGAPPNPTPAGVPPIPTPVGSPPIPTPVGSPPIPTPEGATPLTAQGPVAGEEPGAGGIKLTREVVEPKPVPGGTDVDPKLKAKPAPAAPTQAELELREKVTGLEKRNAELEQQAAAKQAELEQKQAAQQSEQAAAAEQRAAEIRSLNQQVEKLKSGLAGLEGALTERQSQIGKLSGEQTVERQRYKEQQTVSKQELERLSKDLEKMQQELQRSQEQKSQTEQGREEARQRAEQLTKELAQALEKLKKAKVTDGVETVEEFVEGGSPGSGADDSIQFELLMPAKDTKDKEPAPKDQPGQEGRPEESSSGAPMTGPTGREGKAPASNDGSSETEFVPPVTPDGDPKKSGAEVRKGEGDARQDGKPEPVRVSDSPGAEGVRPMPVAPGNQGPAEGEGQAVKPVKSGVGEQQRTQSVPRPNPQIAELEKQMKANREQQELRRQEMGKLFPSDKDLKDGAAGVEELEKLLSDRNTPQRKEAFRNELLNIDAFLSGSGPQNYHSLTKPQQDDAMLGMQQALYDYGTLLETNRFFGSNRDEVNTWLQARAAMFKAPVARSKVLVQEGMQADRKYLELGQQVRKLQAEQAPPKK